ncbi:MAG: amidohydrolase family protein [Gammaproteobacteria bacterium]
MAEPVRVDSHVHLYRTAEEGAAEKDGYEIWEYGEKPGVELSKDTGTVDEVVAAMGKADIAKAIVVNLFSANASREAETAKLPPDLSESKRRVAMSGVDAEIVGQLVEFNLWACKLAQRHPQLVAFVAADAVALPGEAGAAHVREMVEDHGARGVKLHGAFQGFNMSDERLWPTYRSCEELGISVIGHSGPDRGGAGFAEPRAFGEMLKAFPKLPVVLAHMGGATWDQALEIAQAYPNAYFDCCEIIEWTDATNGPTEQQLVRLIKDIGPERVMMGSDYPWYDLDQTVERVMELPLLAAEEKEGIIGANAVRILGL